MRLHGESDSPSPVFVGTAGWHYDDWKGLVYPARMPPGVTALSLLCRMVDLVEINVTYYRPILPRQCETWLEQTASNPRFMFTAKLPAAFTHERPGIPDADAVELWAKSLRPLSEAGKLGAVLAQFPWSFKRVPANRHYLARLVEAFENLPLAVEVRHASWECPEFYEGLRARRVACCVIDQPPLNACLGPSENVTAPFAYVRLHGRNRHHWFNRDSGRNERYDYLYTSEELRPWIERILTMIPKVNRLFVVTNNHYRGQAVVNALDIQQSLGISDCTAPESLQLAWPRQ